MEKAVVPMIPLFRHQARISFYRSGTPARATVWHRRPRPWLVVREPQARAPFVPLCGIRAGSVLHENRRLGSTKHHQVALAVLQDGVFSPRLLLGRLRELDSLRLELLVGPGDV